jgi:hypothetical protein
MQHSKSSSPFHLPSLFCPDIFVGLSERTVLDVRSQDELSVDEAHFDLLASDYTFLTNKTRHPKVHQDTIKLLLRPRKVLESWIPIVGEEITLAFDAAVTNQPTLGKSLDYERSDVHALLKNVITRAANRVICGKDLGEQIQESRLPSIYLPWRLGHNETYVKNSLAFINMVPYASSIIRLFPKQLHP